jgi:hypothetical protein
VPASVELLPASLPRIDVGLCLPHSSLPLVYVTASLSAPLRGAPLAAAHRRSNDQNHEHDRNRDGDDNDAGANREHDKNGAHPTSLCSTAFHSIPRTTVTLTLLK